MTTAIVGALAALGGVYLGSSLNAKNARAHMARSERREFYTEMLVLLIGRRRATEIISMAPDSPPPPDIDQDRVDAHDARLAIDASPEVRKLGRHCFNLMQRFWASHSMGAPVEIDEHGLYEYRYDLVRDVDPQVAAIQMRMGLGRIHDDLVKAIEALSEQMRKELAP